MNYRTAICASRWRPEFTAPGLLLFLVVALQGCGSPTPEPEPVVSVQTTAAKRGPITLTVSTEAVAFPLQQAVITPKIT